MKKQVKIPLWIYSACTAFCLMLVVFASLGVWPFGNLSVLTGDLNGQYINYYATFQQALNNTSSMFYSMEKGLGGALEGILAYYCSSIFSFLYLLVPPVMFAKISGIVLALKVVLCAGAFGFFISKKYPQLTWQTVLLSQCYAFSSYIFVFGQNIMWMDALVFLPIIAYGIEKIVLQNKGIVFTVALGLCIFSNFYIGFMVCIFSCIYLAYLLALKEKQGKLFYILRCAKFALCGALAGMVNGILLLPAMADISSNKGIGFVDVSFSILFSPFLLFRKMFAGSFTINDNINGLPNIYCGIIILALLFVFVICKQIPLKERICGLSLLGVMVISFCVNFINLLWHGTKEPVWFLYRNSFIFVFIAVLLAARVFCVLELKLKYILAACGGLTAVAALILVFEKGFNVPYLIFSLLAGIVAMAALVATIKSGNKNLKKAFAALCCLAVIGELAFNSRDILRRMEQYPCSEYEEFYTNGVLAVTTLKSKDPNARIEKNFFRALCDPMLLGYRGVSHFGSTQEINSVYPLVNLGYRNFSSSNFYGAGSTAAADSFLSIKYLFVKEGGFLPPSHFNFIENAGGYGLYENPYAFPTAFYVKNFNEQLSDNDNPFEYQNKIFEALGLRPVMHETSAKKTGADTDSKEYRVVAEKDGFYYAKLTAPADFNEITELYVNNIKLGGYFDLTGFCDVINLGFFKQGQQIELKAENSNFSTVNLSELFYYLPIDEMQAVSQQVQKAECKAELSNKNISIKLNGGEGTVFLNIPYSPNFEAKLNGEKIEIEKALSYFMAVNTKGAIGQLVLTYKAPTLPLGIVLSVIALIAIILLGFYENKKLKTK